MSSSWSARLWFADFMSNGNNRFALLTTDSFENAFRIDLLVEKRVIVEIKSAERLAPVHYKQLLTYLRLMNLPVGLHINFGGITLKEGLRRIVNQLPPSASPREPL